MTHTHTHTHTLGLLWTRDRPAPNTFTYSNHNIHKTQISMLQAGFEPAIPRSARLQTHTLERAAAGIEEAWNSASAILVRNLKVNPKKNYT